MMHRPKNILLGNIIFFKDKEQQRGGRDNNAGKLSTFGKPVLFKNLVQPSNMAHAMKGENCQKIIKIHLMYLDY